jgi:putative membrane protein
VLAVVQYRKLLKTLKPVEIPTGYWVNFSVLVNLLLAILGLLLLGYLFSHV